MLTAPTRPRMASGVARLIRLERTKTLIMSDAPSTARAPSESRKLCDMPNTIVANPKIATAENILMPDWRSTGQRESRSAVSAAPVAGALRRSPSPTGPTWRMSRANTGRRAVAPPSNTAKRSSEIAPKITGLCRTKRTPSLTRSSRPVPTVPAPERRPPRTETRTADAMKPVTQSE